VSESGREPADQKNDSNNPRQRKRIFNGFAEPRYIDSLCALLKYLFLFLGLAA
jgi:hypothetical protein